MFYSRCIREDAICKRHNKLQMQLSTNNPCEEIEGLMPQQAQGAMALMHLMLCFYMIVLSGDPARAVRAQQQGI